MTSKRESRVVIEDEDDSMSNDTRKTQTFKDPKPEPSEKNQQKGVVTRISNVVRWISDSMLGSTERKQQERLLELLGQSTMFRLCSPRNRERVANEMIPMKFKKGDILMFQGKPQKEAFVIVEGTVSRQRLVDNQYHTVGALGYSGSSDTIGMLHLLEEEPSFSGVKALSDGVAFVLPSTVLKELIEEDVMLSGEIMHSLVVELRNQTYLERTPLFLQQGKEVGPKALNWFAVSVAACIESFYRSGLNAILISQLTGKPAAWFPNMHIQLPSRVVYINGFKGLRFLLEKNVDARQFAYPQTAGLGLALIPGIIMTPVSSILEAQNVTHLNNEPLMKRWTRGLVPRCGREVIFGVGINQLSDFIEERVDSVFTSPLVRNVAGSLVAGAIAGYLSHVPHNLSMLKLVEPSKSYRTHFETLRKPWHQWLATSISPSKQNSVFHRSSASFLTVALPKGCLIRTAQISGSFLIINSAINALKHINVNVTVDQTSRGGVI